MVEKKRQRKKKGQAEMPKAIASFFSVRKCTLAERSLTRSRKIPCSLCLAKKRERDAGGGGGYDNRERKKWGRG